MHRTNNRLEDYQRHNVHERKKLEQGPCRVTTSTLFSHDDYTVGWICALPLEMAAAKAMLDEIHPVLPSFLNDHNTYTLGQMGDHNVVVACMPSGVYGTTSAMTVSTSMLSSFRSIRIGLMVGIGGGAPSKHADIRLGDVVVSKPDENFGGVVQYDYGKTIQDGRFKRIGTLNKPPNVLLTAISQLQADHRMGPSRIPEYLSEMAAKYPPMMPEFAYCGRRPDQLFDAQYEHPGLEDTCEHCDQSRLVTRPPRLGTCPVIHYGLIASGNQVMKHGGTRDRWARELGILCFEMEAAGLMDHFPCLVIRGICDYADSHKNKQWQEYAAATAAACAKEILSVIPGIQIIKYPMVIKTTSIQLPVAAGAAFNSHQDELDTRCHPDTRVDLLREIYDWAEDIDSKCIFWLNGMAGTGKSTISRTIAQTFTDRGQLGASFFFKRGEHDRENASLFFTTIAHDLVRQKPELAAHIHQAVNDDPGIARKALKEQFERLIFQPLTNIGPLPASLILVIDALDECDREGDVRTILSLLANTQRLSSVHVRVFLTSRPELPIRLGFAQMGGKTHRDIVLHDIPPATIHHDISVYLESEFSRIQAEHNLLWPADESMASDWPGRQALDTLTQLAVPLFIVAATICRFIGEPRADPLERLARVLAQQTTGQMTQLERTYLPVLSQLLAGVEEREEDERDQLCLDFRQIVGSIVFLADPLSTVSLAKLLGTAKRKVDRQLYLLHSVLCVPSDPDAPVHLLHLSFREFLVKHGKHRQQWFAIDEANTHQHLIDRCLALLQSSDGLCKDICRLRRPSAQRKEINEATINLYIPRHLQYACRYWVYHLQYSGRKISDGDIVDDFLRQHFLHWLESLSLIGKISESVNFVNTLQSLMVEENSQISIFLHDARRFLLTFNYILAQAPLQVYSSAWHFSPLKSIVKNAFRDQRLQSVRVESGLPERWNTCLQTYEGHSRPVASVVFSPDGSRVVSGSRDNTVRVWDIQTGECQHTLQGHSNDVLSVTFSPDGSRVASSSCDNTVRVWDVYTGDCQYTFQGHLQPIWTVEFSPDGSQVVSGSVDKMVRIWDIQTGKCQHTLKGHSNWVTRVVFSPDGSRVASGSHDNTVRVWSIQTSECEHTLKGHLDDITSVVFSPDGSRVASGSWDNTVRVWDVQTGECKYTLKGHLNYVECVVFSPDGCRVASGSYDNTVRIWDVQTGEYEYTLKGHSHHVKSVVFSPDGCRVASGSKDNTVRVWSIQTSECEYALKGHLDDITSVVFSPDGSRVASGSRDNTVKVWDVQTNEYQHTLEGHSNEITSVVFSPNRSRVATSSEDDTVRIWSVQTSECEHTLEGHSNWVMRVIFSPDGSRVVSGSNDNTVRVWDVGTGECKYTLKGHSASITSMVFSPDGNWVASSSWDDTMRIWDMQTGECKYTLEGHARGIVFSPDACRVAYGSMDNTVRVWDIATGTELLCHDTHEYNQIEFSDDGTKMMADGELISILSRLSLSDTTAAKLPGLALDVDVDALGINGDWVTLSSERVLWLPPEFRPTSWARQNDVVVIGSGAGRVTFIYRM